MKTYIFRRKIEDKIVKSLKKIGIILLLGPRQSGKTTLVKQIAQRHGGVYFNCERSDVRKYFVEGDPEALLEIVADNKLVIFDEAQTIENIGIILKLFHDSYPHKKIIATGSSSFELSNKIKEPMTGRAFEYMLLPLSVEEISQCNTIDQEYLHEIMTFGCYPAVINAKTLEDKKEELYKIATNYLYKDIFTFGEIRNPKVLENLLVHLAWSVGSTVSTLKLSNELGVSSDTVERYIRLLEQAFVIQRVHSFARNYANELKKAYKIYFYDNGIRNALTNLAIDMDKRDDKGVLFESLFFCELQKRNTFLIPPHKIHFWRTRSGVEIDFVVTNDGNIVGYECKWSYSDVRFTLFEKHYPSAVTHVITPSKLLEEGVEKVLRM